MIKACIFDLDGTLLDTLSTITYYVNQTLQKEGFSPITEDECRYFVGDGPYKLIQRSLASKGCTDEAVICDVLKKYRNNYDKAPQYLTAPFDGIPELLLELSSRGILVGVVSNKQDEATVPTVRHFFGDKVTLARGSKAGVPLKPAPDAVYSMLDELGVKPEETVYVGDTGVDMQTGKAFSAARTIGVLWGFRPKEELIENGADVIVTSPNEIIEEVRKCQE